MISFVACVNARLTRARDPGARLLHHRDRLAVNLAEILAIALDKAQLLCVGEGAAMLPSPDPLLRLNKIARVEELGEALFKEDAIFGAMEHEARELLGENIVRAD